MHTLDKTLLSLCVAFWKCANGRAVESQIRVGDAVSVLETGEHCYIKMLKPGEVVEGV